MARPSKQQNIEPWLKGLLGAGRRKAEDVLAAAITAGYSERTLRRVKSTLGIVSEQDGEIWYWRDPAIVQAKPASEDKLDILLHEVKETQRLAQAPVPASSPVQQPSDWITSKKFRTYDPQDPKNIAIAEQLNRIQERSDAVKGVVKSADPFALLESANLDEVKEMLLLVRNYQSGFEPEKPDENDLAEMGKWDEWIDRAKQQVKRLEKQEGDRKNDLRRVLAA